jgi:hypothetical protein
MRPAGIADERDLLTQVRVAAHHVIQQRPALGRVVDEEQSGNVGAIEPADDAPLDRVVLRRRVNWLVVVVVNGTSRH